MKANRTVIAAFFALSLSPAIEAKEATYRVVVSLKEEGPAAKLRVSRSLDKDFGQITRTYAAFPGLTAVVTREGWTSLSAQPDVARVDLDEAVAIASTKGPSKWTGLA